MDKVFICQDCELQCQFEQSELDSWTGFCSRNVRYVKPKRLKARHCVIPEPKAEEFELVMEGI